MIAFQHQRQAKFADRAFQQTLVGQCDSFSRGCASPSGAQQECMPVGEIVTAAGVSAGIDMALHLVARLHSVDRARDVRRYIQYEPEPPV